MKTKKKLSKRKAQAAAREIVAAIKKVLRKHKIDVSPDKVLA